MRVGAELRVGAEWREHGAARKRTHAHARARTRAHARNPCGRRIASEMVGADRAVSLRRSEGRIIVVNEKGGCIARAARRPPSDCMAYVVAVIAGVRTGGFHHSENCILTSELCLSAGRADAFQCPSNSSDSDFPYILFCPLIDASCVVIRM